jgi:hypothetical protein
MTSLRRLTFRITALTALIANESCISVGVEAARLTIHGDTAVAIPSKAQLTDGSIAVFARGLRVEDHRIVGDGWRFTPTIRDSVTVTSLAVDSVAGIVTFRRSVDAGRSIGTSAATTVLAFFGVIIGFIALCAASSCLR